MKAVSGADRNIPCSKCGKKLKDCKGHINKYMVLLGSASVVLLIGLLASVVFNAGNHEYEVTVYRTQEAGEDLTPDFRPDSITAVTLDNFSDEDGKVFFHSVIAPACEWVIQSFPDRYVREEFSKAVSHISRVDSKYSILFFREEGFRWGLTTVVNNRPLLGINTLLFRKLLYFLEENVRDPVLVREYFEDAVILHLLHEDYHLSRQETWRYYPISRERAIMFEAECWGYTYGIIERMIAVGRNLHEKEQLSYYVEIGRNWRDPRWVRYIRDQRFPIHGTQ